MGSKEKQCCAKEKQWRKVSFFSVHSLASPDLQKLLSVLSVKPPGKPAPPWRCHGFCLASQVSSCMLERPFFDLPSARLPMISLGCSLVYYIFCSRVAPFDTRWYTLASPWLLLAFAGFPLLPQPSLHCSPVVPLASPGCPLAVLASHRFPWLPLTVPWASPGISLPPMASLCFHWTPVGSTGCQRARESDGTPKDSQEKPGGARRCI